MKSVPDKESPEKPLLPAPDNLHLFEQKPLKKSRTWFTPDVILLTAPAGERYVLKDFTRRPGWARRLWCRASVHRETRAYQHLHDLGGVPALVTRLSRDSFVMSFLDASPLPRRRFRDVVGLEFFVQLDELLRQMHGRGVAHGDLRRKNILIRPDAQPCLIDFETAFCRGAGKIRTQIFEGVARIDRLTVLKIKGRYFPDQLTDEERILLNEAPWHLRAGRFLRKRIYGPVSPKRLKKRFRNK